MAGVIGTWTPPRFCCLVNAEIDPMGGVDGGVGFDSKTLPRQAAIEKAQAELRQEYDVREERRRELEFLEKGGNPLDFKFGLSASISVQSTSITDQLLEHCSEAKGSVALATSTHGDSAESSGRPGAPSLREPNFADNILLLDSETSKVDGKRNGINTDKRKSIASSGQTTKLEGTNSAREEDSAIFRLGVKSQAYARRNRSRSNRDSPHFGPIVLIQSGQGNQATLPSTQPDGGDTKVQHWEAQVDDHITVCNSKPTSSNENDDSKDFASEVHLGMELDAVKQNEACADLEELLSDKANITSEKLQENNFNEHLSRDGSEREPSGIIFTSSKSVDKGGETLTNGVTQVPCESFKLSESISKSCINSFSNFDEMAKISHNQDQVTEKCVFQAGGDISMPSGLEAEPTCVKVNHDIDRNATGNHFYSGEPDGSCNGGWNEQKPGNESALMADCIRDNGDLRMDDLHPNDHKEQNFAFPAVSDSHVEVKDEECCVNRPEVHDGLRSMSNIESRKVDGEVLSKPEGKLDSSMADVTDVYQETHSETTRPSDLVSPICEHLVASLSQKGSAATPEHQSDAGENIKLVKAHEEAILQEARLIETKLKRAGESPLCVLRSVKQQKSHWDYVLEEMAWLANDFMQERLWKITTASQICRMVARSGQLKFEKNNLWQKQRAVAQILAKAVIKFWSSAEENKNVDENGQLLQLPIKRYAARFLQSESCPIEVVPAEAPKTPDRTSDAGSLEFSWEEQLPDELLYYKIPLGAMNVYRKFVETNWLHQEKSIKITNHVDCETSVGDSAAETIMYENMDDDEAETTMYYMPGRLEGNRQKISHKKRKSLQHKAGASRSYEAGFDLPYVPVTESKSGTQPPLVVGKRPCTLNVGSIPTKRVRTASRQRVVSPFNVATGAVPVTSKTDVSSGETNSFQDDQSTLQGGFHPRKISEFESTVDFERQLPFDGNEVSVKPKKKKKPKYMEYKNSLNANNCFASSGKGSSYEQRWPVDSYAQLEQQDHIKKRPESHHFESNGTSGLYMQQATKKPKILKQLSETSPEALVPLSGPIPSPVASQMSNMSNSNKLTKVIPNRDRGRKSKALKVVGGQSGPGSTWSLFEDQTLVVLVHDMGPNWELISDAINSTVQFKTVFRDPKGCKDRHKILMDKTAGDGADSAEDSGSSQPYPSTLPGIPKGSARQLFQCLQGPMEEDTLKTHFEKIIHIGQKLHSRRIQKDNLDSKQISPAHNSHLVALSQACPNNLAGGPLTPLDLCDATTSNSAEVPCLGYQGAPSNGLALPSYQCPTTPILPASGANNLLQGSPGMVMGNSFPSPSTAPNAPARDVPRYGVPRPASLPVDDQQRLQQYGHGQVISGRNVTGALPVGADRGVRMLPPSANGIGMVCGTSRGMPVTRPGLLNMVSSGSMLSSTGVGIPNPVNLNPGSGHGQGNSMMRPRDSLQMLRTGQNPEDHRQMIMQELQIQATQGNGQTIASFNGISAPFSNQPIPSPPVQTFPVQQHQQPHQMAQQPHMLGNPHYPHIQGTNHNSPQQQAYAMRMAKERQQQQRLVQQPPFAGSNGMTPLQNGPQHQQTAQSSSPMTTVSSSHAQQKQQNLPRNSQATASMSNQIIKQRQRQQIQQQPPRQQQSAPTQAKLMKGGGRGSILMHQNSPVDSSHANGPSATGNQVLEKHMIHQSQSTFSANQSSNSILPQKSNQQKIYGRPPSQSSKQMSAMPSHPDGVSQGQVQVPASQALLSSQQSHIPPLTSQNQAQRQTNQNHQTMHRVVLHQNHQLSSDSHMRSATDPMQATQMIVASTKSSDSVNAIPDVSSAPVSASQWKPEQSYETSSRTPSAHLSNSSQPNLVGTEPLMPASSHGLAQRQFSGSLPVHGHSTGGPWQQHQQQQLQPQQQQQSYPPHQQMHRQAGQGALYGRPSNSGPG